VGLAINLCRAAVGAVPYTLVLPTRCQQCKASSGHWVVNGRVATEKLEFEFELERNTYLCDLHWLPIAAWIDYKIAILTFKSLFSRQPSYLCKLFNVHQPTRSLRSSSHINCLTVNRCHTSFSSRAFCRAAPSVWNCFPSELTSNLSSIYSRGPSCPEIPEISELSWNCPETSTLSWNLPLLLYSAWQLY